MTSLIRPTVEGTSDTASLRIKALVPSAASDTNENTAALAARIGFLRTRTLVRRTKNLLLRCDGGFATLVG